MINLKNNTKPYFAHAPGKPEFLPTWPLVKNYSLNNFTQTKTPKNITITTFNSCGNGYNNKELGTFEKSLEKCGCTYTVLNHSGTWTNIKKIDLLKDFLPQIKTKYILVSDSSDVVILRNLEKFVEEFLKFKKHAVFNAEKQIWPPDLDNSIVKFEEKKHPGHYLNAGLWFGETKFAKEILDFPIPKAEGMYCNSEQRFYKNIYFNFENEIGIDIECKLFQGLNRCDPSDIKIPKIIL